jgi:hypothetical protein
MFRGWWPSNPMKLRRRDFLVGRDRMSDEEFLRIIGLNRLPDLHIAIALRRAIARICSVGPELVHPHDDPHVLCGIMDWGMPKWGWLSVDYGKFSDFVEFSLIFADEYCQLTGEDRRDLRKSDWVDHMPAFAGWAASRKQAREEPATLGEWIVDTVEVLGDGVGRRISKRGDKNGRHKGGRHKGDRRIY